ncbi:MAG: hypothetical protein NC084_03055 [Bacteroides sp.]|nr:hypothetical protein [Bacteroides sp.]
MFAVFAVNLAAALVGNKFFDVSDGDFKALNAALSTIPRRRARRISRRKAL